MPRPNLEAAEVEAVEVLVQEGEQLEEVGRSTPQKFAAACPDASNGPVTSRALPHPEVDVVDPPSADILQLPPSSN